LTTPAFCVWPIRVPGPNRLNWPPPVNGTSWKPYKPLSTSRAFALVSQHTALSKVPTNRKLDEAYACGLIELVLVSLFATKMIATVL
jgi:hypothetical protein